MTFRASGSQPNKLIKRILTAFEMKCDILSCLEQIPISLTFPRMHVQDPDTDTTAFLAIATGTLDQFEQPAIIDPPNSRDKKVLDGA